MGVAGHERHKTMLTSDGHGGVNDGEKKQRAEDVATDEDASDTEQYPG